MKTIQILIIQIIVLFPVLLSAQNLVSIGLGYGFPAASDRIAVRSIAQGNNPDAGYENIYGSYGQGFNFMLGYTHMFDENIGVSLNCLSKVGKQEALNIYVGSYNGTNTMYELKQRVNYFVFSPAFLLKTKVQQCMPYATFGFVVATIKGYGDFMMSNVSGRNTYTGNLGFGYTASAGVEYPYSAFILFGEVSMVSLAWKVTQYEYDYVDMQSTNHETVKMDSRYPLSSWGINIGVRYAL
jgi:hypothetical protein